MDLPFNKEFIDAVPNMAMVLNKERQIVFANQRFRTFAGVEEMEAIGKGGTVTVNCFSDEKEASFTVHNALVIPPEIQRQIFTRSFSTKGSGRGLGTYSIKLITEKYLHGKVSFVSNEEKGTVFTVSYPHEIESFVKV